MDNMEKKETSEQLRNVSNSSGGARDRLSEKSRKSPIGGMMGAELANDTLPHTKWDFYHRVEDTVTKGVNQLKSGSQKTGEFVKKHPYSALVGASAFAFLAGMLVGTIRKKNQSDHHD